MSDLAARVGDHFRGVHRDVFLGEPMANPRLKVEVLEDVVVADTPTMILVAPWVVNGLAFPPDEALPDSLTIGARTYPVFTADVEGLGVVHSVNLVSDTTALDSQEAARNAAMALAMPFREAVERARTDDVADPSKRRLLGLD
ncbi:MAG: [NiFe]-hydrogenase assembly chaperone HybE [Acidimicrobiia bacterium]|nr:[NiFe]-hydrogenase assembly chaperone HybE [Acidimicrobiia bacterium]